MLKNPKIIKNILVVRNDRFGEFLLNIPALGALKETFPNAKITCIVSSEVKELAQAIKDIDQIIEWGRENHHLRQKINLFKILLKNKFNMAIMLNPSKEFNIFTFFAGIPIRVGYNRKTGFLLTHKIQDTKYLGFKHEVEYNLELVGLIGAKTQNKSLTLELNKDAGLRLPDNFITIHPWTSDPIKQWPLENFVELSQRIINELKISVVIVGGPEHTKGSNLYFGELNNLTNLTGKTTLTQLAWLLSKSSLLISGDSGPVHLASCVNTPVVAIFRNDLEGKTPRRWGPWGEGHIVIERNNLTDISVDEVFEKIKQKLLQDKKN